LNSNIINSSVPELDPLDQIKLFVEKALS